MTFLVQIKKLVDGTYSKGTSEYQTEKDALTALYVAMSAAMQKTDTQSIMCLLTDEFGSMKKREYWSAPATENAVEEYLETVEE